MGLTIPLDAMVPSSLYAAMTTETALPIVFQLLLLVLVILLPAKYYGTAVKGFFGSRLLLHHSHYPRRKSKVAQLDEVKQVLTAVRPVGERKDPSRDIHLYKELYHKVQNLEEHPEILPIARDLLISLFAETLGAAFSSDEPGILAIEHFSLDALAEFMQNDNDRIVRLWEKYVARRRRGSPPDLFKDKEEAKWWLKQLAPVKYVDGAWLGHINKMTTPFAFRKATKDAWQVMSEELGDGNPELNHVYVYRDLMKDIGAGLPEADTLDFIHDRHRLDDEKIWKAAVAQLLISLFPHEFLPEILGFNLHFEGLTMETMKAGKELEEFGLNPYYFILHISIDNADSGHTAIAMHAVVKYLDQVRHLQGDTAVQSAWRRVQAGFILSKELSHGPQHPSRKTEEAVHFPRNDIEAEVIRVFKAKSSVAYKLHCSSRIKFGGRQLDDWFEPQAFNKKQWQMDFLDHLGNMKPWVRKGDSVNSRLMHELQWGGKMFGSFTQSEVEAVRRWIDALGAPRPQLYWKFIGCEEVPSETRLKNLDIRIDCPVFTSSAASILASRIEGPILNQPSCHKSPNNPDMALLLPLWFTSPCLLESFVSIPAKTTSVAVSSIVRLLRAQIGFENEGLFVAGMDEVRRTNNNGLVEMGLEMMRGLGLKDPGSLKDILETFASPFSIKMLELSARPMGNKGLLLGLAWAFIGLHDSMTSSMLLSTSSKTLLKQIAKRERDCLKVCFQELRKDATTDKSGCHDFYRGYGLGSAEIATCFGQKIDIVDDYPPNVLS